MGTESKPCWFVGACFGGKDDQVGRFLADGVWEINNPSEKDMALVKSMNAGDRIAIKSTYTRKKDLPFDNRGNVVSVMAIKATGTITKNRQDGSTVEVHWDPPFQSREWYFYTYQPTIWRILPGEPFPDDLVAFAFEQKAQDIDRFRNAPYWRERFGTQTTDEARFSWARFYQALADKLLPYRDNRAALLDFIEGLSKRVEGLGNLAEDQYADGGKGFLRDICPFTTMGLFNRWIKDSNRKKIAGELAAFLGVDEPVPVSFDGIPVLNNQKSWLFGWEKDRPADHIDTLWDVFALGLRYADADEGDDVRVAFEKAFDKAMTLYGVAWNLTFGLYWTRPWSFLPLDSNSQTYVTQKLGLTIGRNGPKNRANGNDYLTLMDAVEPRFQEPSYPVHSYPELSLEAWRYKPSVPETAPADTEEGETLMAGAEGESAPTAVPIPAPIVPYDVDAIIADGAFFDRAELNGLLNGLRSKKNLILQGPPGTGKTWLAKRLAFALIGQKDDSKVRAVQFHPNLSYEDFVRGWRPSSDKQLSVKNGIFMEMVEWAAKNPFSKFVMVIEEINRGNPAQIFGELLTLLEAGKRTPNEALELCYPDEDGVRRPVHIPENLFVIGTMNIADRSLALVDLALRRRFAFVTLEPRMGQAWRDWVVSRCNVDGELADEIEKRVLELNDRIAADPRLGKQCRIGHSYLTPPYPIENGGTRNWFFQAVRTEIFPLLEEYWFDAPDEANKASQRLLQGL